MSKILPCLVHVVDEGNESGWGIHWPKWHNIICPLCSIGAGECQLYLRALSNRNLMVALGCNPHPVPEGRTKEKVDGGVTTGDWICNNPCDLIERDEFDVKSPDEIPNVGDVFLMRFWGKQDLELLLAFMNLMNMINLFKGGNAFAHDRNLPWTVMNLLGHNGSGVAGINDAAVVLDRDKLAFIVKDRPVFLNEAVDRHSKRRVKM